MQETIKLRWKPIRAAEWKAIPEKKRKAFKASKGVKNVPLRGADIDGSYYLDIYDGGSRRYEFLNLKTSTNGIANDATERIAQQVAIHWSDEKWRKSHGFRTTIGSDVPFIEWFRSLVPNRHRAWKSTLLQLEEFAEARTSLARVDSRWLVGFQKFLLERVSQNSASTYYSKVKAALQIAFEQEILSENPANRTKAIRQNASQRTYLTLEELQALAKTPCKDSETKRAFLFACYTGLRLSDVKRLRWKDYQTGRIQFEQKKTGQPEHLDLGNVAETLLLNGAKRGELEALIFAELPGEGVLWTHLQAWCKAAGITKHVSFHVSRHTFATLMLETSKDLFLVSKLLGHTDIKHTQVYAKIVDDRRKQAMHSLPAIELQ